MTGKTPANNMSSSPASAGTRTHYGSPSTNPTVMSPDCATVAPVFLGSMKIPTIAARRNLAVPNVAVPQHLSPTAEEFTPGVLTTTFVPKPASVPINKLGGIKRGVFGPPKQTVNPGIIGDPLQPTRIIPARALAATLRPQGVSIGTFTVDESTRRAYVVCGLNGVERANYAYIAGSYQNFKSLVNINAAYLQQGSFAVEFSDLEDAKEALVLTQKHLFQGEVLCYYQTPKDIALAAGLDPNIVSNHQAEYLIHVIDLGKSESAIDFNKVVDACQKYGRVKAFASVPPASGAHMSYRVEFFDARTDVNKLSGALLCGFRVCIERHTPDVVRVPTQNIFNHPAQYNAVMGYYSAPKRPEYLLSPGANNNVVDLMKIYLGQDVRTTIMLRNIPNRVDQDALKALIDKTSKGAYDFMYLRIDFANDCNVGYAFINFVDPMAIVPFAKARAGQRWNLFHSDKVAEISYATIQGKDCLVQKFRNSSVMLEREEYRPKLYKTGTGDDAGTEEPFPVANNISKLRRSLDNAETVGLYRPKSNFGPIPYRVVRKPIRAPRNQIPGGVYNVPAPSRLAPIMKGSTAIPSKASCPKHTNLRVTSQTRANKS